VSTDHSHDEAASPAARVAAIESLLVERGLLEPTVVEQLVQTMAESFGPMNGARVVAKAWTDPAYRERLLADGAAAIAELGFGGPQIQYLSVVENGPGVHNVVVCTLCSCYPWPLLGLPPDWYKSVEYRSAMVREPRAALASMGTVIPEDVEIRIWDSSAEVRYLVLPERPEGTDGLDEAALAELVTRDAMVGVERW